MLEDDGTLVDSLGLALGDADRLGFPVGAAGGAALRVGVSLGDWLGCAVGDADTLGFPEGEEDGALNSKGAPEGDDDTLVEQMVLCQRMTEHLMICLDSSQTLLKHSALQWVKQMALSWEMTKELVSRLATVLDAQSATLTKSAFQRVKRTV